MAVFGYSGLSSSPTSQQTSFGSIQPWAQPYIQNYLTQGQQLAASNVKPTALQQQAYDAAANLGTPEQFAQGSNLANQAGQGQLSTAPVALGYGAQGAGIGSLGQAYGMNAGANYAAQATNPYAVGAYMNPYIQQSLAPQLALLNQQQQIGAQDINAKAAGQGAFGGNRATLAQSLNAQNYDLARQQAIGQGYNQAFQQAQQAQQFGANLGLQGAMQGTSAGLQGLATALQGVQGAQQGYSGATQAGAALGNIGAQQSQADLARIALQNQLGTQQYNLPFQNVQFQQGLLSGLPISTQTTQGYTAPPSTGSQIIGAGTTLLGGYLAGKAFGAWKKGGPVKSYAEGGDVDPYLENMPTMSADMASGLASLPSAASNAIGSAMQPRASVVDQTPVSSDELANLYQQYLGRGVDESGAKSFTGLDRTTVINSILNSPEYQSRGVSVPGAPMTGNILQNAGGKGDQLGMLGRVMGNSLQRQPVAGSDLATLQLNRLLGTAV